MSGSHWGTFPPLDLRAVEFKMGVLFHRIWDTAQRKALGKSEIQPYMQLKAEYEEPVKALLAYCRALRTALLDDTVHDQDCEYWRTHERPYCTCIFKKLEQATAVLAQAQDEGGKDVRIVGTEPTSLPCPARRWARPCPYPSVCRDKETCVDGSALP